MYMLNVGTYILYLKMISLLPVYMCVRGLSQKSRYIYILIPNA